MESYKNLINNKFIMFIAIIYSGIIGYIFNSTFLNINDFFYVLFNPVYSWMIILYSCCFCSIYAIYLTIKKKTITYKNMILCWLFAITFSWSFIGQMGNADAIAIVYGKLVGELFTVIMFILDSYLIIKNLTPIDETQVDKRK